MKSFTFDDSIADSIATTVDDELQDLLEFGDEFYDVEVLTDLSLKFIVGGDADVDVHTVDKYNFDDYSRINVSSDFNANLLQKLCDNVNGLLEKHGIDVRYHVVQRDAQVAEKSISASALEEYYSNFGKTQVRYACDVKLRASK